MGDAVAPTLQGFLNQGSELLAWLVDCSIDLINTLMAHPVTACFLIIGLIGLVFTTYGRITGR